MAPVAGFQCLVRRSGDTTAITTEPLSIIADGSSVAFRITDSARRVIDPNVDFHLKNGTTTLAYSAIASMDFLNGEFTLAAAAGAGSVTSLSFSGSYLPLTTAAEVIVGATSFKLNQSTDLLGIDIFTGSTTDLVRKRLPAMRDASLDVDTIGNTADLAGLATAQFNGTHVVTEVFFGADTTARFRGICQVANIDYSGAADGLNTSAVSFKIAAVRNATADKIASMTFKVQP
jgi:predicted secreted protein